MKKLTEKQKEVLTFLVAFLEAKHRQATTREIQEYFGWKSQTGAACHLAALQRKGYISIDDKGRRKFLFANVKVTRKERA